MRHAADTVLLSSLQGAHSRLTRIIDLMAAGSDDFLAVQELRALVWGLENSKALLVNDQISRHWEQVIRTLPRTTQAKLTRPADVTKYL